MNWAFFILTVASVLLTLRSAYSAMLMLYAWKDGGNRAATPCPTFEQPRLRFTLLLPARREEAMIQATMQRMVDLDFPRHLVQVLMIIEAGDHDTIAKVDEKPGALWPRGDGSSTWPGGDTMTEILPATPAPAQLGAYAVRCDNPLRRGHG